MCLNGECLFIYDYIQENQLFLGSGMLFQEFLSSGGTDMSVRGRGSSQWLGGTDMSVRGRGSSQWLGGTDMSVRGRGSSQWPGGD